MKKILALSIALMCLLSSCAKTTEYRDDLPCSELTAILDSDKDFSSYGDEKIKYFFEDTHLADSYSIIYSTEPTDIDELGVFHTQDGDSAKALYDIVVRYIDDMRKNDSAFISSYAPEELPKLDKAEVRIFGNYVVYAILDDSHRQQAFNDLASLLSINK